VDDFIRNENLKRYRRALSESSDQDQRRWCCNDCCYSNWPTAHWLRRSLPVMRRTTNWSLPRLPPCAVVTSIPRADRRPARGIDLDAEADRRHGNRLIKSLIPIRRCPV
jgi:hypothetical protein